MPDSPSFAERHDGGYFALFGRFEGLLVYTTLTCSLVLCFQLTGEFGESASLLAPLAVGLSVMAGLRFRMAGTIASGLVAVCVFWTAYALGWGALPERGAFFGAGLVAIICLFSLCSSLVVGYHSRTGEIALQRENILRKVFEALPIGIWVRSRGGQTVFVNERWASFSSMTAEEILSSNSTEPPVDLGPEWDAESSEVLLSSGGSVRYRASRPEAVTPTVAPVAARN